MILPLFSNFNYKLSPMAAEVIDTFQKVDGGHRVAGWKLQVPAPGPDGVPMRVIIPGLGSEHRGAAFRLFLVAKDGTKVPGDAEVTLEATRDDGTEKKVLFHGRYEQFMSVPDQYAPEAAVAVQKRAEVGREHFVTLSIKLPFSGAELDLDETLFEIDVYRVWLNISA